MCSAAAVLTLTHLPQDPTPEVLKDGLFHVDKIEHVFAYGVICVCALLSARRRSRRFLAVILVAVAIIALFDELTQPLVGRTASLWDFVADTVGIALALATVLLKQRTQHLLALPSTHNAGTG